MRWQPYESTGAAKLYAAGLPLARIAAILRRPLESVRSRLSRDQITRPDWYVNPGQFAPARRVQR